MDDGVGARSNLISNGSPGHCTIRLLWQSVASFFVGAVSKIEIVWNWRDLVNSLQMFKIELELSPSRESLQELFTVV